MKLSEPQRAVLQHLADGERVKSTNSGKIRVYCGYQTVRMDTLKVLKRNGLIVGENHEDDPRNAFTHWLITDAGSEALG